MWTPDYFVRYIDLPASVDSLVIPNDDGTFDIYINNLLPHELQKCWLEHELEHIRQDHFYVEAPNIAKIEKQASGLEIPKKERVPDLFNLPPGPNGEKVIPFFSSLESLKKIYACPSCPVHGRPRLWPLSYY